MMNILSFYFAFYLFECDKAMILAFNILRLKSRIAILFSVVIKARAAIYFILYILECSDVFMGII